MAHRKAQRAACCYPTCSLLVTSRLELRLTPTLTTDSVQGRTNLTFGNYLYIFVFSCQVQNPLRISTALEFPVVCPDSSRLMPYRYPKSQRLSFTSFLIRNSSIVPSFISVQIMQFIKRCLMLWELFRWRLKSSRFYRVTTGQCLPTFFLYLRLLISTRALPSRYTKGYLQRC